MPRVWTVLSALSLLPLLPPGTSPAMSVQDGAHESPRAAAGGNGAPGFIENRGQADDRALYLLQRGPLSAFATADGVRFSLDDLSGTSQRWGLAMDFVDARRTSPVAKSPQPGVVSYFHGSPEHWISGAPIYGGLVYPNLWPGIDARLRPSEDGLKTTFVVRPQADPSDVRLDWRGATSVGLEGGAVMLGTPAGNMRDEPPVSWQATGRGRVRVPTSYVLSGSTIGFRLGAYDGSRPLVIDPEIRIPQGASFAGFGYVGYVGGSGSDVIESVELDATNSAYIAGWTTSTASSFPEKVGPDLSANGDFEAFVGKVNSNGQLVYLGFMGGPAGDSANGVAVDAGGSAYVTGLTASATFPTSGGPDTTYNGGDEDAFIAKVDPSGTSLVYSGFIGADGTDWGIDVAVDGAGAAHVLGRTDGDVRGVPPDFPTAGASDPSYNGGALDAFLAKVAPSGASLVYSGFIGGSATDGEGFPDSGGVDLDSTGAAYVTSTTHSGPSSFPDGDGFGSLPGFDQTLGGPQDAFLLKVDPAGSLVYGTYVGGTDGEYGAGVAVDASGAAYLTGDTWSDETEGFPLAVGPDLDQNAGGTPWTFVTKVAPAGTSVVYSGFIEGEGFVDGYAIDVDAFGRAHVAGDTSAPTCCFPVKKGPDGTYNGGGWDAWIARVNASGASLGYLGYIGGSSFDSVNEVAVNGSGTAYVVGWTSSSQASFPESGGPDITFNGGPEDLWKDGYIAKVKFVSCCAPAKSLSYFLGTAGSDLLKGTPQADFLAGLGGDDVLKGLKGKDILVGGSGDDRCRGGPGRERVQSC